MLWNIFTNVSIPNSNIEARINSKKATEILVRILYAKNLRILFRPKKYGCKL